MKQLQGMKPNVLLWLYLVVNICRTRNSICKHRHQKIQGIMILREWRERALILLSRRDSSQWRMKWISQSIPSDAINHKPIVLEVRSVPVSQYLCHVKVNVIVICLIMKRLIHLILQTFLYEHNITLWHLMESVLTSIWHWDTFENLTLRSMNNILKWPIKYFLTSSLI